LIEADNDLSQRTGCPPHDKIKNVSVTPNPYEEILTVRELTFYVKVNTLRIDFINNFDEILLLMATFYSFVSGVLIENLLRRRVQAVSGAKPF